MNDALLLPPSNQGTRFQNSTDDEQPDLDIRAPSKSPLRRNLLWLCLVVIAFIGGWGLAQGSLHRREKEVLPAETGVTKQDPLAVMVTTEPVTYRVVQRTIDGVGTLHGFEEVSISAKMEGRVRKIRFDVADCLKPGELLLEIDPTESELSVQQAERALLVELAKLGLQEPPTSDVDLEKIPSVMQAQARRENFRSRYERVRKLETSRTVSAEDLGTATSDDRAAQAEYANQVLLARAGLATIQMKQTAVAMARQQLEETQVRVPSPSLPLPEILNDMTYAVTQRSVAEGTLVRSGTEICKLVINQMLKLRLPIPERYGPEVKLGQTVKVQTAAFPRPFNGHVSRINPSVDPTTRTFEVEILVPNVEKELKPGSFANASILCHTEGESTTVPLTALVNFAGIEKVFLSENGRAKERHVTLGMQTTEWVEIISPTLPRGADVVTSGQSILADDTPITLRVALKTKSSPAIAETR